MTEKELIEKIVTLYKEARVTTILRKNIRRGRSHSVSSRVEDLFAIYIAEQLEDHNGELPENIELLIDQPFTYKIGNKTYSIYPDIAIIQDSNVIKLFDIKMDLGWNRDFFQFCKSKQDLINEIRQKDTKAKDGATKEQRSFCFSNDLKYNIVIVSNENISKAQREKNQKLIKDLDKNKIELFILTQGAHPNIYEEKVEKGIQLRDDDLKKLREEIKKNIP